MTWNNRGQACWWLYRYISCFSFMKNTKYELFLRRKYELTFLENKIWTYFSWEENMNFFSGSSSISYHIKISEFHGLYNSINTLKHQNIMVTSHSLKRLWTSSLFSSSRVADTVKLHRKGELQHMLLEAGAVKSKS